jgi:hypothetical protein
MPPEMARQQACLGPSARVKEADAAGGGMGHFSKREAVHPQLIRFNVKKHAPGGLQSIRGCQRDATSCQMSGTKT